MSINNIGRAQWQQECGIKATFLFVMKPQARPVFLCVLPACTHGPRRGLLYRYSGQFFLFGVSSVGPWFWIPALDQSSGCDVTARQSRSEQCPWLLFESLFDFLSLSEQAAVHTVLISFGPSSACRGQCSAGAVSSYGRCSIPCDQQQNSESRTWGPRGVGVGVHVSGREFSWL